MVKSTEISEARRALLAKYLQGNLSQGATPLIPRRELDSPVPLSFGQEQLWFLAQLIPDIPVYNECVSVHMPEAVQVPALEQSLNEIIRRHEAWRTTFPIVDGQPMQKIHSSMPLTLPVVDLRHLSTEKREAEALRLAKEQACIPYNLAQGPLLRTLLVRLEDEDYRLFVCLHHMIFDGISIYQIFLSELSTLYTAFAQGHPEPHAVLPPLPLQYADYACWQRRLLEDSVYGEQLAYWKRQLKDAPSLLELPVAYARPLEPRYCGAMHPLMLSKNLTEALKTLSRQEGVTLYILLVAVFYVLLYRYTEQEDILLGTAIGDRKYQGTQQLLGFFLNTLVLRTKLSGDLPFRHLLKRVRDVVLDAQAHADVPFEYLVKELQPERTPGQNPFFQVSLTLVPEQPALPCGWTLTQMEVETDTAKFGLSLQLDDRPEGLIGRFEYNTDLFHATTIARMSTHWQCLLESVVSHPTERIGELSLLSEEERRQLLLNWNAPQEEYVAGICVHQLFEHVVEHAPNAIAIVYEHAQLTYEALNEKANQLAHSLRRRGVGPEATVGICVGRSPDMIIGLLATLKAGGAFVPLDPSYPRERLAFMIRDSGIGFVLTHQPLLPRLPAESGQAICLDTEWEAVSQESATNLSNAAREEDLAYVIYTSGSTGEPKGVQISRGAITNHCLVAKKHYELRPDDRVLQFSTFTFDAALEQILPTLISGAQLVIRGDEIWSATEFQEKIVEYGLTVINLPTTYWQQLAQAWADAPVQVMSNQLRLVIVGGDRMLPHSLDCWWQTPMRAVRLLNAYGPTEATITAAIFEIPAGSSQEGACENIPIGRPLAQRTMYILDAHGCLVPVGIPGELYIGGKLLAKGYLHRPELTAERFIADPFSEKPHARLYKTGDRACYLADGNIAFLGRVDHQVKIRNYRIEPGEIERVLKRHAVVNEVVVVAREDALGEKRLVAYVVAAQGRSLVIPELRAYLRERLPEYMLPSAFMQLAALPQTLSGKVDRQALPPLSMCRQDAEESYVAPTLPVHVQLVQLWEELLDVSPIGIRDNFFALGGHSLLAVRLFSRIEQVCGKKLPVATLFAGATIEHLAHALLDGEQKDVRAPLVALQSGGSRPPFFYLHGDWTGSALYCRHIASDLGPDQPFYALEPYKFDGLPVLPTFEAMVEAHLHAVRAVQPEGPYLLGGFCNGAIVAYEMARRLQAEGQRVDLLLLVDPGYTPAASKLMCDLFRRLGRWLHWSQDQQLHWFLRLRHVYKHLQLSHEKKAKDFAYLNAINPELRALFPPIERLRRDYVGLFTWVASVYQPGTYSGEVTFFCDSEEFLFGEAWRNVAATGKAEVVPIPGSHTTCRTDHVHELSRHIQHSLDKAQMGSTRKQE